MRHLWTAIKIIVPLLLITLLFYWLAIGPQYGQIRSIKREMDAMEGGIARLESELAANPPLLEQETELLWKRLEVRNAQILTDESTLIAALAELAQLAERSGAEFTNLSIENPSQETREVYRRTGRRGVVMEEVAPEPTRLGATLVQEYKVHLAVKGRYASWTRLLASMSREMVPVLLDSFTTRPTEDGGQLMLMSMTAPARKGAPAPMPEGIDTAAPIELPRSIAEKYHTTALTKPVSLAYEPVDSDPFPYVPPVVEPREPLPAPNWQLTAVIKRDGRYMAVIDNHVLEVGQVYQGRRLVRITPDAAIFVRND